ncbi:hypothetical protein BRX36_21670 [Sphingomonas sp. S-NIH.Pt1_0416]|uniref:hypothetical protein n=1 Tax=Sphingomonas TaxID=13687 RepID=UPI000DE2E870|nr:MULTISPECIES: hypothetical protein [Sphingomonas]QBE91485.1 hypothetical protein DRN02_005200 [Sphingomonas paucimobilis]RSU55231.1 hypothetical protein BRX36_21670 [Sphingomonas sp. S-NIH.Pt1_0416]
MKFVKLLTAAHVAGVLRHPHEGVLHVSDDDAARLIGDQVAKDVSADFADRDTAELPAEPVSNAEPDAPAADPAPHQSDVAPPAATEAKPKAGKASADKE